MTAPPPSIIEVATPNPPRFWWLKRLLPAGFALAAVLLALRAWWGHEAQRLLDAEIAAAHARGEPVLMEDFNHEPLSDEENAAVLLKSAAAAIKYNPAQMDFDNRFDMDVALSDSDRRMLAGIVAAFPKSYALATRAATLQHADWGVRLRSPVISVLLPHLNDARQLANYIRYAALEHHMDGNDALAVRDISCILREGEFVDEQPTFLVTHLVAIGIESMASETAQLFAAELQIVPGDDPSPTTGPATTAQVRAMIARLLDDHAYRQAGQYMWFGERVMSIDDASPRYLFSMTGAATPLQRAMLWPVRPMLQLDALRMFRTESAIAHAMAEPTAPAAAAKSPAFVRTTSPSYVRRIPTLLSDILMPSYVRANSVHYRDLTDRRLAVVLLAIRLYQVDHNGAAPPDLNALVRGYLPAVPIDPLSPQAEPLRYVATPGAEAVYSVGENGRDDGAATRPTMQSSGGGTLSRWHMLDAVVPFHRPPLKPPPATEPAAN